MIMRRWFFIIAGVLLAFSLFSCANEYAPYRENRMGRHFYCETRDLFFYNGIEPLSRAVRLEIIDTISDPSQKEAMTSYLLEKMSIYRDGNTIEIGSLNYDTGGKGLFEEGAVWHVTNDYLEDFDYVIEYAGDMSWNVSFDCLMNVYGYYTDIRVKGEYLFRFEPTEGNDTMQDFVIEYATGSYKDERSVSEGVGVIDISVDEPVTLAYMFFNDKYNPMPFIVDDDINNTDIYLYKGRYSLRVNTLPNHELNNETYIFDLGHSDRYTQEVYVSYNGVWSPIL